MNHSSLFVPTVRLLGTVMLLVFMTSPVDARYGGLTPSYPMAAPEHNGETTTVPAIIVGSGPHNLRIWSENDQQNEVNVLLGGLQNYEYIAQVRMIDLRGNTIVDESIATPNGFLNMRLTAETPLPKGTYLITIRTSDRSWTDRVEVQ